MLKLPTPILGSVTAITISSPDLEKSLAYYQLLGFSLVMRADWPFPWIQVSDGVLLIMLREDATPYIALTYYVKDIDNVTKDLEKKGIQFNSKPKKTDKIKRYLLQSPDGLNISLVGMIDGFTQPPGPGMLHMKQEDYFKPAKYANKTAGMYGEFAHPVKDLEASIKFWEFLGFTAISTFTTPYPWAIISDGLSVLGLHQTSSFSFPAITYFASDMAEKITALKNRGLQNFTSEGAANAVLSTPEQQHIFLHQLGGMGVSNEKKKIESPVIETERMWLKELNPEIMNALFTTCNDEEIISFMGLTGPAELATVRGNWEKGMTTYRISYKWFLMVEKASGKVIGRCGYHNWYADHSRAELGYSMDNDAVKRKGFMKEALQEVIRHGFEHMALNRVEAFVGPNNVPSLKLVRGFGLTEEGTLRSHYCKDGKMEDSVCFSLLQDEYRQLKDTWNK